MPELPYRSMPVPATPIWQLKGWILDIKCSRCRRYTVLPLGEVADRIGQEVSVSEVVRRLRCGGFRDNGKCRARPAHVKLVEVSYYGKSMRKLREVTVMG
jgi:hypothetical protein